jgi:hypothetical protein
VKYNSYEAREVFASLGGPSVNQTPRPSSLEVLNKGKLKGRMSVARCGHTSARVALWGPTRHDL